MANINQIIEDYLQEQPMQPYAIDMGGGVNPPKPFRFVNNNAPPITNDDFEIPEKPTDGIGMPDPNATPPRPSWTNKLPVMGVGGPYYGADGNLYFGPFPWMIDPDLGGYNTIKPK
tara:strand:- start:892 stop:1239 length:348 start_codon:yes stop_codon:yes gene_type:complete